MADEIYIAAVTGLTPSLQLYQGSSTVGSPFAATEIGTTGDYVASVPGGVALGIYLVLATAGDEKLGSGLLYWNGFVEVTPMMYYRLHRARGLDVNQSATNNLTNLTAGEINVDITGDLETTTTYTATS